MLIGDWGLGAEMTDGFGGHAVSVGKGPIPNPHIYY